MIPPDAPIRYPWQAVTDERFADEVIGNQSTIGNLMRRCHPDSPTIKPCFDKRLVVASFDDDASDSDIDAAIRQIKSRLGKSSATVWHSRDIYGIASYASGDVQALASSFSHLRKPKLLHDLGVFRFLDTAAMPGTLSPLSHFLKQPRR